jgi:site-specific DNA-methyltransferase (adenine-specific)
VLLFNDACQNVFPKLPTGSVQAIIVDPPMGKTFLPWDKMLPWKNLWPHIYRIIKPNAAVAIFAVQPFTTYLINTNIKDFKYDLVWNKGRGTTPLLAKRQPMRSHETICIFYQRPPTYNPQMTEGKPYKAPRTGGNRTNSVIGSAKDSEGFVQKDNTTGLRYPLSIIESHIHSGSKLIPTQKPVALLEWLIKTYTNEGELVLDFCAGSGSTGAACKNTGRDFIGIEPSIQYYDVMVQRLS